MTLSTVSLLITAFFVGTYLALFWLIKNYMFRKVASLTYCYILGIFDICWHCFLENTLLMFWCGVFLISFGFVESVVFVVNTLTEGKEE